PAARARLALARTTRRSVRTPASAPSPNRLTAPAPAPPPTVIRAATRRQPARKRQRQPPRSAQNAPAAPRDSNHPDDRLATAHPNAHSQQDRRLLQTPRLRANCKIEAYLNVTLDFGRCGRQARGVLTGLAVASS